MSKYIEVHHPNSLIYIGFATHSNDITLHLLKYISNDEEQGKKNSPDELNVSPEDLGEADIIDIELTDKGHFKSVLKLDRIDSSINPIKLVLFVQEPGTYKLIFDNSFSWFTSKTIRHRLSVLRPLSEIDVERKVDFEQLKMEMNKDFVKTNTNNTNELEKQDPQANKILMVKFEGKNRAFKIDKILAKENKINADMKYATISVILTNKKLRIYYDNEFLEFEIPEDDFPAYFEKKLDDYFSNINDFDQKTVFLNVFIIEKTLINDNVAISIPITNDEFIKNVFCKLGFYPDSLVAKYKNVKFFVHNLAESCLLYLLYQKVIENVKVENLIHIHFDKYAAQPTFYMEGVINDKISGFVYDKNLSLLENATNVVEFAVKITVIFGGFEMSISYSDIDER